MKYSKFRLWLSILLFCLLLSLDIWLGISIAKLDMLPANYLAFVIAAMVLAALLPALLLFAGKKPKGLFRQILGWVLSIVICIGCFVAAGALSKAHNTISSVTNTPTIDAVVDVYVLADDSAQTLGDAREYTFAVSESYDWENTCKALDAIQTELRKEITTASFSSVFAMADALYAGEVDAIILNSAFLDIFSELDTYAGFPEDIKTIYEYAVTSTPPDIPSETSPAETNPTAPKIPPISQAGHKLESAPFLIYLSGSDTRSKLLTTSRSDVNIIAAVNPQTKQVLLLNTPRDYFVGNPAGNGAKDKLTHCGIYGIDCSVQALENLYNTQISYYAQINFTGFKTLIDAVGGVTVYSDVSFITTHGNHPINVGENHLNGAEALGFARERYSLAGGDNDRGKNQMKIISAFIDKLSAETVASNYADILESLEGMFITNMPQSKLSELVKMQISDMSPWNVISYAVSGTGGSDITFSMPGFYAYVTYPNERSVALASELIDRVLSGEKISQKDLSLDKS